jgi:hypothetical protein
MDYNLYHPKQKYKRKCPSQNYLQRALNYLKIRDKKGTLLL